MSNINKKIMSPNIFFISIFFKLYVYNIIFAKCGCCLFGGSFIDFYVGLSVFVMTLSKEAQIQI